MRMYEIIVAHGYERMYDSNKRGQMTKRMRAALEQLVIRWP